MKRIRLNSDRILLNATALAAQLTTQMPSSFLSDVDRAYFAHVLGIHALCVKLFNFGSATTELIELLSPRLQDNTRQLGNLIRKLNALGQEDRKMMELKEEVQSVVGGNLYSCSFTDNATSQHNIYAYVLMRHRNRGFQHYQRRLKLVIPAATDQYITDLIDQGIIEVAPVPKYN